MKTDKWILTQRFNRRKTGPESSEYYHSLDEMVIMEYSIGWIMKGI